MSDFDKPLKTARVVIASMGQPDGDPVCPSHLMYHHNKPEEKAPHTSCTKKEKLACNPPPHHSIYTEGKRKL